MFGAATQLREADVRTNGIHLSVEPQKNILDAHGEPIRRESMMVRLDKKAGEPITVSRGTLWFIGTLIAVVPIAIAIIAYTISIAMGYQGNVSKVTEIDARVTKVEAALVELQQLKANMAGIERDVNAIKKNQDEADIDRKDILKNMADIRILLAQKQLSN